MTVDVDAPAGARRFEEVWGTVVSVDIRDPIDPRVLDAMFAWFRRVDDLFSTWRADTEISRIGRAELDPADASAEVREVLARCADIKRQTDGAFDVTVGAHPHAPARPGLAPVDPSGFVKGWALERAVAMATARGATRLFVNGGGDVVVRSGEADPPWRIGIQHPWQRDKVAAVVGVASGAVATSGRTERGDHVLDPRTGLPASGLVSVTVIGADLACCDALATAAVARGSIDTPWLRDRPGYSAMAITDDGVVVTTLGFERFRRL